MRTAVVVVMLASCHAQPAPASDTKLSVELQLYVTRSSQRVAIPRGGLVHSGEVLALEVTPSRDAYLYIVQVRADGKPEVLAGQAGDQTFAAGGPMQIPPANAEYDLAFDDTTGAETFYVIASPRPLSETDAEAAAIMERVRSGEPLVAPAAPAIDAGVAAAPPIDAPAPAPIAELPPPAPDAGVAATKLPDTHKAATTRVATTTTGATASGLGAPVAFRARGIERHQKVPKKIIVDADAGNVVVFPYSIDHQK